MTIAGILKGLREVDPVEKHTSEFGELYRMFLDSERYVIDFDPDFTKLGWKQFDTDQDAPYYGVWVNKKERMYLNYAEGDWTLRISPSDELFNKDIKELCEFHKPAKFASSITRDGELTQYFQDRKKFFI